MAGLFEELKRRNVVRVGIAYLVAAWLVLQVVDLVIESVSAPAWVMQMILLLSALGFPLALGFAWAFELTPEGLRRERDVDRSKSITPQTGRRLDRLIIVVLVIAVGFLLTDKFLLRDTGQAELTVQVPDESPAPQPSRRSIAVLPFVNRSNAQDDVFFVDGIHDDILTQLAKISSLKVISRTSVMQYRNTEKPMRVIGKELAVATIMEGSVQRAGKRVRINVQLIDADTDEHLWAEVYDRELTAANIFEIQTEMATAIAGALRATLTSDEAQRLALKPTENLEAYEAYLIGRQRMAQRTVRSIADAKAFFERAINLDPEFALAYVGISDTIQLQVDYGGLSPAVVAREAKPYIDRALELDGNSGEAYVSLGGMYDYARDYDAAEDAYLRGLDLAPNYAQGHMWYGLLLLHNRGLVDKALEQFQQASVHDPLSVVNLNNVSTAMRALGRFDDSRALIEKTLDIDPQFARTYLYKAYDYWMVQGRLDLALEYYLRGWSLDPGDPLMYVEIAQIYMDLTDDQTANCWLDRAIALNPDAGYTIDEQAIFSALRNDREAAAEFGRRSPDDTYGPFWVNFPLSIVKGYLLQDGRDKDARQLYEEFFPELFDDDYLPINRVNMTAAVDVADILLATDEQDRAQQLLAIVESFLEDVPRLGEFGQMVTDVRIHTLRGDTDRALELLQQAVDEGWRYRWRYFLEVNNVLEPLRSLPEFESIYREISADMASQLERVRAKETLETSCTL
ncbi:MAG: tetratricopeptide repeat protein [Proteobacteria bacterium]|nr:tetratricopeptide repeat protein [Pseudomonadota bacterium]